MSGTTGTVPLQTVIPGQTIAAALWNGELANIGALMDANGVGGHSDTDSDMQIQTNPYPGSVLSKPTSEAGELERIRYVIAQMLGNTYWYQLAANGNNLANIFITGEVRALATPTIPSGFLECDGTSYLRTDYAALFAAIGTTWGSLDGTHFSVPDYRGRVLLGAGTGSGLTARSLGDTGGEETHVLTTPEIPAHLHGASTSITDPTHSHGAGTLSILLDQTGGGGASHFCAASSQFSGYATHLPGGGDTGASATGVGASTTTTNTGGGGVHNNMQPWACVKYVIKT